jgi:uncharacterized protein YdhG (YjbR/CyaY superfamily)
MGRSSDVDAWFARLDHPLKPAMQRVREVLLEGDPRLEECIKWQCPTFTYEGDLASINPIAKKHVTLLFHTGAQIPGRHTHLEGGESTARLMKFADLADVEAKRPALTALARVWCDWKASASMQPALSGGTTSVAKQRAARMGAKKAPAKKRPAAKKPAAAKRPAVKKKPAAKKPALRKKIARRARRK